MTKIGMEMAEPHPATIRPGRFKTFMREVHTWLAALSIALAATVFIFGSLPDSESMTGLARKYLGPGAPFFAGIGILILYAFAAFVIDAFGLAAPRRWAGLGNALHWAQESAQWTGLISSFYAFMIGINTYSQNLANGAAARQEFLQSVSLAITSTLAGGVMALIAFTLLQVLPTDEGGV
jgi:cytochrome c biogenesis factor